MSSIDPNDSNLVLSPLADPVAGAIFANKAVRKGRAGFYKRFVLLVLYVIHSTSGKENRAGGGCIDTRIAGICR